MADLNAYFKSIIDQDREALVICDLDHTIRREPLDHLADGFHRMGVVAG